MMNKSDFEKALREYIQSSADNLVKKEAALRPDLAGLRIYDEPLFGYAYAGDPYFTEAKKPGIIGTHFMAPEEWLPGAKTVLALFLPFTEQVREANGRNMEWPVEEWLHARIQGQAFQDTICRFTIDLLKKEGFSAMAPMVDPRFLRIMPVSDENTSNENFNSNWSERHAAYAAGLGTFGLSKGLITKKGVAGRYISIITTAVFEPEQRPYTGVYDYCSFCGACERNCPAKAISLEKKEKSHHLCSMFLDSTREKHEPYFGCGKCQVKVPCEFKAAVV